MPSGFQGTPFERLQGLGEERFRKILNLLMRGESTYAVAREIQAQPPKGWGLFQDVAEQTLIQQLNRLRKAGAEGMFGSQTAKKIVAGVKTPQIKLLENTSVRVLERLEELSDWQRNRVMALIEREKEALLPVVGNLHLKGVPSSAKMAPQEYRHLLTQTNLVFNDYKTLLLDLQKIRFDLGLDDFRGPVTGMAMKGLSQTTTLPDGSSVQKQIFEAVTTIEQIFEARQIPHVIARSE
jgi:hypothetical protein